MPIDKPHSTRLHSHSINLFKSHVFLEERNHLLRLRMKFWSVLTLRTNVKLECQLGGAEENILLGEQEIITFESYGITIIV